MTTLNLWKSTWSLDEAQCPCDIHFLQYLEGKGVKGAAIFGGVSVKRASERKGRRRG